VPASPPLLRCRAFSGASSAKSASSLPIPWRTRARTCLPASTSLTTGDSTSHRCTFSGLLADILFMQATPRFHPPVEKGKTSIGTFLLSTLGGGYGVCRALCRRGRPAGYRWWMGTPRGAPPGMGAPSQPTEMSILIHTVVGGGRAGTATVHAVPPLSPGGEVARAIQLTGDLAAAPGATACCMVSRCCRHGRLTPTGSMRAARRTRTLPLRVQRFRAPTNSELCAEEHALGGLRTAARISTPRARARTTFLAPLHCTAILARARHARDGAGCNAPLIACVARRAGASR